jgi:hypothetical protein
VDGEVLVRDGVYLRGDERAIVRRAVAAVTKVWARAAADGILAPGTGFPSRDARCPSS